MFVTALRRAGLVASAVGVASALVIGAGILVEPGAPAASTAGRATTGPSDQLSRDVIATQERLRRVPTDWLGWAGLGAAYVEQARRTADPTLYAKAEGALQTSLRLHPDANSPALSGLATLAAARHEFTEALSFADRSLKINDFGAATHGVRGDTLVELGRYDEAFAAFQRMVDLRPGTASYARASYSWELRGDLSRAVDTMRQARDAAGSGADAAFASYHLGVLMLDNGDVAAAQRHFAEGLRREPGSPLLTAGMARVAAARGDVDAAVAAYGELVAMAPLVSNLVEYGELLDSLGRPEEAAAQYEVVRSVQQLFAAAGVQPDAELALFEVDHGDPAAALAAAGAVARRQPGAIFVEDALAWALHVNGRDAEALRHANRALRLGTRSALLHFHRGMIEARLGRRAEAIADLDRALRLNPAFSARHAPTARRTLAALRAQQ